MPNIGPMELVVILIILILLFGAKRIPDLAKSIGQGLKEFKKASQHPDKEDAKPDVKAETPEKK